MDAYSKSKELYFRLRELFDDHCRHAKSYTDIVSEYVNFKKLRSQGNCYDIVGELAGNEYTLQKCLDNAYDYNIFLEDCCMMVYRLNGGEGYNTYELIADFQGR